MGILMYACDSDFDGHFVLHMKALKKKDWWELWKMKMMMKRGTNRVVLLRKGYSVICGKNKKHGEIWS